MATDERPIAPDVDYLIRVRPEAHDYKTIVMFEGGATDGFIALPRAMPDGIRIDGSVDSTLMADVSAEYRELHGLHKEGELRTHLKALLAVYAATQRLHVG